MNGPTTAFDEEAYERRQAAFEERSRKEAEALEARLALPPIMPPENEDWDLELDYEEEEEEQPQIQQQETRRVIQDDVSEIDIDDVIEDRSGLSQLGRIEPKLTSSTSSVVGVDDIGEIEGAPPSAREGRALEAPSIPARSKRAYEEIEEGMNVYRRLRT